MSALHKLAVLSVLVDLSYALRLDSTSEAGFLNAIPNDTEVVWIDVGMAGRSDFEYDFETTPHAYLIGMEPTPKYATIMKNKLDQSKRFAMFQNACTNKSGEKLKFYVHPLEECNSLNPVNPKSPKVFGGDCIGKEATEIAVNSMTLEEVLREVPGSLPIQLLKIDVQGHELPCIQGAGDQLDRVANLFIEVQDIQSGTTELYQNSLSLGAMDVEMEKVQFFRQYCEVNNIDFRELNCLYTRKGETPLWATGRPQGRMPTVKYDLDQPPMFRGVRYVFDYRTTKQLGQMADKLLSLGMRQSYDDTEAETENLF